VGELCADGDDQGGKQGFRQQGGGPNRNLVEEGAGLFFLGELKTKGVKKGGKNAHHD